MKANQKFLHDDNGQVGIGTMIVFIATVLVAAVAAGVLINVSGDLQSQSLATGKSATDQTASFIEVTGVWGQDVHGCNGGANCGSPVAASSYDTGADGDPATPDTAGPPPDSNMDARDDKIDEIHIFVELAAGASAMDMAEALVYLDMGSAMNVYKHWSKSGGATPSVDDPNADGNFFHIEVLSGNAGNLLEAGEKFKIRVLGTFDNTANDYGDRLNIGTNVELDLKVITKEGGEKKMSFTTPHVLDDDFERLQ